MEQRAVSAARHAVSELDIHRRARGSRGTRTRWRHYLRSKKRAAPARGGTTPTTAITPGTSSLDAPPRQAPSSLGGTSSVNPRWLLRPWPRGRPRAEGAVTEAPATRRAPAIARVTPDAA